MARGRCSWPLGNDIDGPEMLKQRHQRVIDADSRCGRYDIYGPWML
jgi:hypothetical protein